MSHNLHIAKIFSQFSPLINDDTNPYESDVVLTLKPWAVLRPKNLSELKEIIKLCALHKIPFTPCGNQTSVTGASVSDQSIVISTEKLKSVSEISKNSEGLASIQVEPGILLSDLQDHVESLGYYYPPDPTSREEVFLGGTIATNATGENSYHYGSTRNYILSLDVIDAQGQFKTIQRQASPLDLSKKKNLAGFHLGEEIDPWIGSEGTLGIICSAKLLLLPKPNPFQSFLLFFPNEPDALNFSNSIHNFREKLSLRCLEYMDIQATEYMRLKSKRLIIPKDVYTIYLKIEETSSIDQDSILELLYNEYNAILPDDDSLFDQALFAQDHSELLEFRRVRHHVPATINELATINKSMGGGKVSSDWWVPNDKIIEMFTFLRELQANIDCKCAIFGHIGNGHPHVNMIATNQTLKDQSLEFTKQCIQKAVSLGGGACGEHGLGKIKTWALALQWSNQDIDQMKQVKQFWDPCNLSSPGNIFS
ncbi:MAG: FAD-binding oxidoreductase [Candidatus Cloacimonetes bacterium]|nr:FAD-binding oxidoreductase [Candidatus Cloacimonadota bacterium]